jgi:hypothetical protein
VVDFCPAHFKNRPPPQLVYMDQPVKVSDSFSYLGSSVHRLTWFSETADRVADSASRAMHALNRMCGASGIRCMATRMRLFDILVKSVGSYGCQVWGVEYLNLSTDTAILDNPLQKLQLQFLRSLSGVHSRIDRWSLLREFGQYPVQLDWICLCARFWNKTCKSSMLDGEALRGDIILFQAGNIQCWTYKFLRCMLRLSLLGNRTFRDLRSADREIILDLTFPDVSVRDACLGRYKQVWETDDEGISPRDVVRKGALRHKYFTWFHDHTQQWQPHMQMSLQHVA